MYLGSITSDESFGIGEIKIKFKNSENESFSTKTEKNGKFKIGPIQPGEYEVEAEHEADFVTMSHPVQIRLGSEIKIRSEQMPRIKGFKIRGHVVGASGGLPVENVEFTLRREESTQIVGQVTSGAKGEFVFEELTSGRYSIEGSHVDLESGTVFTVTPTKQTVIVSPESPLEHFSFRITGLRITGNNYIYNRLYESLL